jgi:hypothetical protein
MIYMGELLYKLNADSYAESIQALAQCALCGTVESAGRTVTAVTAAQDLARNETFRNNPDVCARIVAAIDTMYHNRPVEEVMVTAADIIDVLAYNPSFQAQVAGKTVTLMEMTLRGGIDRQIVFAQTARRVYTAMGVESDTGTRAKSQWQQAMNNLAHSPLGQEAHARETVIARMKNPPAILEDMLTERSRPKIQTNGKSRYRGPRMG